MELLLLEQIRGEVARCVRDQTILRTSSAARRVSHQIGPGTSLNAIAAMLLEAGIAAAVAVEIEMPEG